MELVCALLSNLLFVFYAINIFSYRRNAVFFLEMKFYFIFILVAVEVLCYYIIYAKGVVYGEVFSETTILYWRGGVPAELLNRIGVRVSPLASCLVFDYVFFLMLSIFKRQQKARKKALKPDSLQKK